MKSEYGVNNPKPKILQMFCKHKFEWYIKNYAFFNLSGETHYKICEKCGKVADAQFVPTP